MAYEPENELQRQMQFLKGRVLSYGDEAQDFMMEGVELSAKYVGATLGPRGAFIGLELFGTSHLSTNDGVTVARDISSKDPRRDAGNRLIRELAMNADAEAGDGTTTATLLGAAAMRNGIEMIRKTGYSGQLAAEGMDIEVAKIQQEIHELAIGAGTIAGVERAATVSSRNPALGAALGEAFRQLGPDATIIVEETVRHGVELSIVDGARIDSGLPSDELSTEKDRVEANLEDALVLITSEKITTVDQLTPAFNYAAIVAKRPLIIFGPDMNELPHSMLVNNWKSPNAYYGCFIPAPKYAEQQRAELEDLCLLTGAKLAGPITGTGLVDGKFDPSILGEVQIAKITKSETTLTGFPSADDDAIDLTIANLKQTLSGTPNDDQRECAERRLGRLAGGVAILRVGTRGQGEAKTVALLVEDAMKASRAVVREGWVAGGAVVLAQLADRPITEGLDPDQAAGAQIVRDALTAPLKQLLINCGAHETPFKYTLADRVRVLCRLQPKKARSSAGDVPEILTQLRALWAEGKTNAGYEGRSRVIVEDLIEVGIIDPAAVTTTAVRQAVSIATSVIKTMGTSVAIPPDWNGPTS